MTWRIESPCRNVCRLGPDQHCDGCGRTAQEIARWISMTPAERAAIIHRTATWRERPPQSS